MAHRGFAKEAEALTRIDASSLLATRAADEGSGTAPIAVPRRRSGWQWAVAALLALAVGAAVWLLKF